jgi:hypothetical protein
MTTEQSVSAGKDGNDPATPEEEKIAQQVADAATKTDEKGKEPKANSPAAVTADDLERVAQSIYDKVQGQTANWNSAMFERQLDSFKTGLKQDLRTEITNAVNAQAEATRVETLDPEEQVLYWRDKALKPDAPVELDSEPRQDGQLTETERQSLASYAIGALRTAGLDPAQYQSPALWTGTQSGMPIDQMAEIFSANVARQQKAATPTPQQATPPPPPPPSTQDAPQTPGQSFDSKTEIAGAFGRGELNIDQYKAELVALKSRA